MALEVGTNSYISVADATTYFDDRLYSDGWTDASAADKAKALVMATKTLDRLLLRGRKKLDDQVLEFPRCYSSLAGIAIDTRFAIVEDYSVLIENGWYCELSTPQRVLDAVCEEALALLTSGNDPRRAIQRAGVKSYRLGSLSETFADGAIAVGTSSKQGLISDEAKALMRPYIAGAVAIR